uniref:Oxysterol-binding protein n=1 Tax=Panagrellus redivivus TaxID=6233 RepID=A0A7E4UY78_PANRE
MSQRLEPPSVTTSDNGLDVNVETIKSPIPAVITRTTLPAPASNQKVGIWGLLKHAVGKDLSRLTMPILLNEPLSFLQRLGEYMEYHELITYASKSSDPVKRIEYITAFAMSALASGNVRLTKPFNPLLGETYELNHPELGFEFVAEQVSHHPPISAFFSQGPEFEFYGSVNPLVKFWGRSVEIVPQASFTLILKPYNEVYTWQAASCSVNNIMMGKMYMCLTGTMNIVCLQTHLNCNVKFNGPGRNGADPMVEGVVLEGKKPLRVIYGNWTEYLASTSYEIYEEVKNQYNKEFRKLEKKGFGEKCVICRDSNILWRVNKKPPNSKDYYYLTYFAMMLNEAVPEGGGDAAPPRTDCRYRPDIRLLEEGALDPAAKEKDRLENKQRSRSKMRKDFRPKWFKLGKDPATGNDNVYIFNQAYFNREFADADDIF